MNYLSLICFFLLFMCGILFTGITSSSVRMSVKNMRNVFNNCTNESNCNECAEEGYYKVCRSLCYCCNFDNQCKAQN